MLSGINATLSTDSDSHSLQSSPHGGLNQFANFKGDTVVAFVAFTGVIAGMEGCLETILRAENDNPADGAGAVALASSCTGHIVLLPPFPFPPLPPPPLPPDCPGVYGLVGHSRAGWPCLLYP